MNQNIDAYYLAQAAGPDNFLIQILPFILIFVVFYFLLIRPQQKKMKAHQQMINNVRRGDSVTTGGGLIGKVTKVSEDGEVEVEIAKDVKVKVVRSMLADVKSKGEPAKAE